MFSVFSRHATVLHKVGDECIAMSEVLNGPGSFETTLLPRGEVETGRGGRGRTDADSLACQVGYLNEYNRPVEASQLSTCCLARRSPSCGDQNLHS